MPTNCPPIEKYMSRFPLSVTSDTTLAEARALLSEHSIHHLPVVENGVLLGVLSDRDIQLLESFGHIALKKIAVTAAMTHHPFVVRPETPIDEVVSNMMARRVGSAVVMEGEHLLGIFTSADALAALDDALSGRLPG